MGDIIDFPCARIEKLTREGIADAAEFLRKESQERYPHTGEHEALALLLSLQAHCWVVRADSVVVGLVATRSNCIEELWVNLVWRNRGWGRRLIGLACESIRESGFQFAQIGCTHRDIALLECLRHLHWRQIGDEPLSTTDRSQRALVFSHRL